jgi:hypothetical protein
MGDIITTGTANDSIWINATTNTSGSSNLNAGLGNDTYRFLHTSVNSSQITDAGGTDTLALTGATSDISGLNNGGSLIGAGIEQVVVTSGGVMSIATGQVTGAVAFNGVAGANLAITQTTAGTTAAPAVTNIASATFAAINYLSATGATTAGTAVTAVTIVGGSGVDAITGSATLATTYDPAAGADAITLGVNSATDLIVIRAADSGAVTATVGAIASGTAINAAEVFSTSAMDIINGFVAGDTIQLRTTGTTALTTTTANTAIVVNGGTFGGSTSGDVALIRGTYSAANNTFTAAAGGTSSALIWDDNGTTAAGSYKAVILVGYVDAGTTDTVGATGLFTGVA